VGPGGQSRRGNRNVRGTSASRPRPRSNVRQSSQRNLVFEPIDAPALRGQGDAEPIGSQGRVDQGCFDNRESAFDEGQAVLIAGRHRPSGEQPWPSRPGSALWTVSVPSGLTSVRNWYWACAARVRPPSISTGRSPRMRPQGAVDWIPSPRVAPIPSHRRSRSVAFMATASRLRPPARPTPAGTIGTMQNPFPHERRVGRAGSGRRTRPLRFTGRGAEGVWRKRGQGAARGHPARRGGVCDGKGATGSNPDNGQWLASAGWLRPGPRTPCSLQAPDPGIPESRASPTDRESRPFQDGRASANLWPFS